MANQGDAVEPISIRIDVTPGCPSSETFWQSLQVRAPGIRLARPGEPARVFSIHFQLADDGMARGRLRITDIDGSALEREISGPSCAEVGDALALIAAIGAREPAAPVEPNDAVPRDRPPALQRPSPRVEIPDSPAVAPSPATAPAWTLSIRAEAVVRTRIVPAPLYGLGAGFAIAHDGPSIWQPAFGAHVDMTLTATASTNDIVPNTEMTGQLISAHLLFSPLRLRAGPIDVRAYASLDVGRLTLRGRGEGLRNEGQARMFWLSAALLIRADLRLGDHWTVGAMIGAAVHPLLFQFQFTPRDVYQVGTVGLVSGVAWSFLF